MNGINSHVACSAPFLGPGLPPPGALVTHIQHLLPTHKPPPPYPEIRPGCHSLANSDSSCLGQLPSRVKPTSSQSLPITLPQRMRWDWGVPGTVGAQAQGASLGWTRGLGPQSPILPACRLRKLLGATEGPRVTPPRAQRARAPRPSLIPARKG